MSKDEEETGYPDDPIAAMYILTAELGQMVSRYHEKDRNAPCSIGEMMDLTGRVSALSQAQFGATMEILQGYSERMDQTEPSPQRPDIDQPKKPREGGSFDSGFSNASRVAAQAKTNLVQAVQNRSVEAAVESLQRFLLAFEEKHLALHVDAEARHQSQMAQLRRQYERRFQDLEREIRD